MTDRVLKKGPRKRLSRDLIIETTMTLVEGGDAEGLTFRSLSKALGTDATAIYRHFDSKDDLVLSVLDRLMAEVMSDYSPTGDWKPDLWDLAQRLHRVYLKYPHVGRVTGSRTARRESEFYGVECWLTAIRLSGADVRQSAAFYRILTEFTLAYSLQEATFLTLDPAVREQDLRAWEIDYRSLPPDKFPAIAACAEFIPALSDPTILKTGFWMLLDSIERLCNVNAIDNSIDV